MSSAKNFKFNICGYNQAAAIKLDLNHDDLLILRWFDDFKVTGKMVEKVIDGITYYWVNYNSIAESLPILRLKKDTVYRKLKKMANVEVLAHITVKEGGTFSYFGLGSMYKELINLSDENPRGMDENPRGYGQKSVGGTDKNPEQKILLLNNNSSIKDIKIDEHLTFFEKLWKEYPNKKGKSRITDKQKKVLYQYGYEIFMAIERYKTDQERNSWRKWQQGSTFFTSGYMDYLDENYQEPEPEEPQKVSSLKVDSS